MSYVLASTSTASPRDTPEDVQSSSSTYYPHSAHHPHTSHDMGRPDKGHQPVDVDIVVNSDTLVLRGTGVDVTPALLSGNVVLYLSEPTSIKEISLSFRGKARIPPSPSESALNASLLTYVVCHHEWSFLEGNRSHSHTLKAGRHLFPFQLHIGGSLPCTISTTALGGASVSYKLRASVVRPGFALGLTHREITCLHPIYILRGFSPEALEYQQTLEIENTWPEKLMYSIMIPHKAWPAGDRVIAVVKFSPLVKGARVQSVTTTINETVKLHGRGGGVQENSRVIATAKHDIVDGQAVCIDEQHHRYRIPLLHHHAHTTAHSSSPTSPVPQSRHGTSSGFDSPAEMTPLSTVTTNSSASSGSHVREPFPRTSPSPHTDAIAGPSTSAPSQPPSGLGIIPAEIESEPSQDVVTTLQIIVPTHATPAHTLEPIQVSHRIRWSIMIANTDGHVSELRCSLPLYILDHRLYDEAHAATLATRRLLLGARDVDGGQAVGTRGDSSGDEEDLELPTYPEHVRDRVANAFLPETSVMRVTNPWVAQGVSPVINGQRRSTASRDTSGMVSPAPMEVFPYHGVHEHDTRNQLPPVPSSDSQELHWVNSELLMSLSDQPEARATRHSPSERTPPDPDSSGNSRNASRTGSRFPSRRGSRANSRAASPERILADSTSNHVTAVTQDPTYVHSQSAASRNLHGLFHMSMKPFTSLTSSFNLGHRSHSGSNLASTANSHGPSNLSNISAARHSSTEINRGSRPPSRGSTPSSSGMNTPATGFALPRSATEDQILLHRAFIETPDYEVASRGFLGGGIPPLSSFAGLPSYEEAAAHGEREGHVDRSMSENDLARRVEEAMRLSPMSRARGHRHQGHRGQASQESAGTSTAPPSPPRRAHTEV